MEEAKINIIPKCVGCHKEPKKLSEYVSMGKSEGMTPEQFVKSEEGTYNSRNGHFYCSPCYLKAGMPLGQAK